LAQSSKQKSKSLQIINNSIPGYHYLVININININSNRTQPATTEMELTSHSIFLVLFIVLTIAVMIIFMRDRKLILQGFSTKEQINAEVKKQFDLLNKFDFPAEIDFKNSALQVSPNMEIIRKYRDNVNGMLGPIEETVKKDTAAKNAEIDKLKAYAASLNEYARRDFMNRMSIRDLKTIKSHNNGLELSINKLGSGPINNYQVRVNDGCLKVPFTNDAIVVPCNASDPDQVFSLDNVFNEPGYRAKMDPAYPQLDDLGQVRYPFSVLRAKSNGNCLKNFHGSLSVEPCREYEGQRWAGSERAGGLCPP